VGSSVVVGGGVVVGSAVVVGGGVVVGSSVVVVVGATHAHGFPAISQQSVATVKLDTPAEPAQKEMHVLFVTVVSQKIREPMSH